MFKESFRNLMQNLTKRQKQVIIVALFGFLLLIVIIAGAQLSNNKLKPGDSYSKVDKNSGDVVNTIVGESESVGGRNDQVLVLGLSPLLKLGMTTTQTNALKDSLTQYSKINKLGIKKFSLTTKSIEITTSGDPQGDNLTTIITSPILADDKTKLNMKITYKSSKDLEVFLYDTTGKLIYDSGITRL